MFGIFKKKPDSSIKVMGHNLNVVSLTRDGALLYTGDVVKSYPKDHLEGKIFEISFSTRSGTPYFAYYYCEDYYFAVVGPGGSPTFGPRETEEFRSAASQSVAGFLVNYLKTSLQIDASNDITSFSHNSAHTNVLTYVQSLDNWYPIQHSDAEDDDASERKASDVNEGRLNIADVLATSELSP